jgi:hypothetical protein
VLPVDSREAAAEAGQWGIVNLQKLVFALLVKKFRSF